MGLPFNLSRLHSNLATLSRRSGHSGTLGKLPFSRDPLAPPIPRVGRCQCALAAADHSQASAISACLIHHFYYFGTVELIGAVTSLSALAQPSRLEVFRLLVRTGGSGLCAGEIAELLDLPKPTLSFHLKELARAELIEAQREGRSIIYRVRVEGIRDLMAYLTEDCCQGRPDLCLPADLGTCC